MSFPQKGTLRDGAIVMLRGELRRATGEVKDYALKTVSRYKSIVEETGIVDKAMDLHLEHHGCMNAFLEYTIKRLYKELGRSLYFR